MSRRAHYEPLSHDALVAIVVELLDERDRLVAEIESLKSRSAEGAGP